LIGALEEDNGKVNESFTPKEKHLLKHRELFFSRIVETLPATQIRGKCSVALLNETESLLSYLEQEVSMGKAVNRLIFCEHGYWIFM